MAANATEAPVTEQERAVTDEAPTPTWELECTCPDFCERDHERD
jgi:hypothetical protein